MADLVNFIAEDYKSRSYLLNLLISKYICKGKEKNIERIGRDKLKEDKNESMSSEKVFY